MNQHIQVSEPSLIRNVPHRLVWFVFWTTMLSGCLPDGTIAVTPASEVSTPSLTPDITEIPMSIQDLDGDSFKTPEDCDDRDPSVHPYATEMCDGIDNNCNGLIDMEDPTFHWTAIVTYFPDADRDGFGAQGEPGLRVCRDPSTVVLQWVSNHRDCKDDDEQIYPGAEEILNGVDDDCDGEKDEGLSGISMQFTSDK